MYSEQQDLINKINLVEAHFGPNEPVALQYREMLAKLQQTEGVQVSMDGEGPTFAEVERAVQALTARHQGTADK